MFQKDYNGFTSLGGRSREMGIWKTPCKQDPNSLKKKVCNGNLERNYVFKKRVNTSSKIEALAQCLVIMGEITEVQSFKSPRCTKP